MFRKSVLVLAVLALLQISSASPVADEPQLVHVQPRGIFGDFLQNVIQGIEDAVRDIADLIENVLRDLRKGLQTIIQTVGESVRVVIGGTFKIIGTAIRANVELLRKFRDALLRPALTNANLSLERLQNAIAKAIDEATHKFNEALLEIDLQAQQVLNSVQRKVEQNAEEAKEVIRSLVSENNQNESVEQCLLEQLQAVKDLDKTTVDNTNQCITNQVKGAEDIAGDFAKILENAFDGVDPLIAELEDCTAGLPNRPSFSQRRESSTCLNTVALKIQLAASQVSTDIAVKVGDVLRPLAELRGDLQQCASKNLEQMQNELDEINTHVDHCLN